MEEINAGEHTRLVPSKRPDHRGGASYGTDDASTLKKTQEVPEDSVELPEKGDGNRSEEWEDLCNLARDTFQVYFTESDFKTQPTTDSTIEKEKGKLHLCRKIDGTMPHLTAYLKKLQLPSLFVDVILFAEASFRGIAQVYLQNNPLSGVLILAGMFVQSARVAVHGIIAVVAGNLAGLWMGFDESFYLAGLFGYNSFLVGLALATFSEDYSWPVAVGAIVFAYFSSVLFVMLGNILSPFNTPALTLPFNISTLVFLLAVGGMNNVDMAPVRPPELPSYESEPVSRLTAQAFLAGSIRGLGQVFLADDIISGVLVLVGIMLCSRISALAAFIGSAVGAGVAALVGCNRKAIEAGMYGFNPSLTMTAMLMFYVPSTGSSLIGIVASAITVFIQLALATSLEPFGLPFMTLPFCLASLAFIVIQGTTSNLISVPLSSVTTPEDHVARVKRLSHGFELLYGAIRSSTYGGSHSERGASNSAFSHYDKAIHGGGTEKGFFRWIVRWCNMGKYSRDERSGAMSGLGIRMSSMRNACRGGKEKESHARMFNYITTGNDGRITKAQFKSFLLSVGLAKDVGLDFACEAFQLVDLDRSGYIGINEFFVFVQISKQMPKIRGLIVEFFDFVDVNGNRSLEIDELESSHSYLGLPPLPENDHVSLSAICSEDGGLEFDTIMKLVTIFKLESMVRDYQDKRQKGHSLEDSIDCSIRFLKV